MDTTQIWVHLIIVNISLMSGSCLYKIGIFGIQKLFEVAIKFPWNHFLSCRVRMNKNDAPKV